MARKAWRKAPSTLAKRYQQIQRKIQTEATGATKKALGAVESSVVVRVKSARRVSKQDNPRGRDLTPARVRKPATSYSLNANGVTGRIEVFPFWTGARSKAVVAIFGRLGLSKALLRNSLLVISGKGRKVKARDSQAKPRRLGFAANPSLKVWGEREKKGQQIRRHSVYLARDPLRFLVVSPALKDARGELLSAWQEGVRRGFL